MVEVTIARLGLDSANNSYVVVLREKAGERTLPIWIGTPEAESIIMHLNHGKRERPLTHDLCKALVESLGGTVRRVTIRRIENNTYFAELHLQYLDRVVELDARPSDAIAIALRCGAPIFVAPALLIATSADVPDAAPDGDLLSRDDVEQMTSEKLQAYLKTLRPEDFGKFAP